MKGDAGGLNQRFSSNTFPPDLIICRPVNKIEYEVQLNECLLYMDQKFNLLIQNVPKI